VFEWGIISAEEARVHPQRNQITNCLGGVEDMFYVEPSEPVTLQAGDVLLLAATACGAVYRPGDRRSICRRIVTEVLEN